MEGHSLKLTNGSKINGCIIRLLIQPFQYKLHAAKKKRLYLQLGYRINGVALAQMSWLEGNISAADPGGGCEEPPFLGQKKINC